MIGIVVSRADSASEHLAEHLLALREWDEDHDESRPDADGGDTVYRSGPFELRTFDDLHLHLDGVAAAFGAQPGDSTDDVDLVVFASRHSGETGPLLTAHFTGNFGDAEFGGADGVLATAAPAALDAVVSAFDEHAPEGYDVGVECTHHGPSEVGAPSLFVELGSDEPQWEDPEGARAVARAILALSDLAVDEGKVEPLAGQTVVGFGGGHYAPRFERVLRETDWSVGHVAPDWALETLGDQGAETLNDDAKTLNEDARDVVHQAFERSGAEHALVDGEYPELEAVVEDLGYRIVSETWLREVDGVPLDLADAAEDTLCPVEAGLRFGDGATDADGDADDFTVVSLPDDLIEEALAVDDGRTRGVVAETTLAYETEENGNRPLGRAAVRDERDRERLVDRLVAILADHYESVERRDGEVLVRERTFDPGRASKLGVPEGPKFGKLASGQSVVVDGETVRPEAVTEDRIRRVGVD